MSLELIKERGEYADLQYKTNITKINNLPDRIGTHFRTQNHRTELEKIGKKH